MTYNNYINKIKRNEKYEKIIIYILIGVILAAGLGLGFFFLLAKDEELSANAQTYVSLSINPAVEFTVNEDNFVISTVATDEEGDQIIQSYDFYGISIENACEKFTQLCIKAGYVDFNADDTAEGANEVKITVVDKESTNEENIANKIKLKINNCFEHNGVFGFAMSDELLEYQAQATEYGVSVGHIKLVMSALDYNPELTFEELIDMPINEVVALVNNSHRNMIRTTQAIRTQLKLDLEALKTNEDYVDMFNALDTIAGLMEDLNNETLTEEQITQLENQITTAKTTFSEIYGTLFREYKEDKKALIDQAKEDSQQALETIKTQYRTRIQDHKENFDEARNNSNSNSGNIKNRIRNWQQEQTTSGD